MKRVIAVLAVALTCSAQTAAAPSPNQIYDRARAAVAARTLPRYLAYTATAAFARKGKTQVEHLRVVLRTADGRAYVTPLRDSARDRIDHAVCSAEAAVFLAGDDLWVRRASRGRSALDL